MRSGRSDAMVACKLLLSLFHQNGTYSCEMSSSTSLLLLLFFFLFLLFSLLPLLNRFQHFGKQHVSGDLGWPSDSWRRSCTKACRCSVVLRDISSPSLNQSINQEGER